MTVAGEVVNVAEAELPDAKLLLGPRVAFEEQFVLVRALGTREDGMTARHAERRFQQESIGRVAARWGIASPGEGRLRIGRAELRTVDRRRGGTRNIDVGIQLLGPLDAP